MTGADTVIFSDKPLDLVQGPFTEKIKQKWPNPIISDLGIVEENSTTVFFAKDQGMFEAHDEIGFELNSAKESCFMILASQLSPWNQIVSIEKDLEATEFQIMPYSSTMIFRKIWMYTLVTPELPEEDSFSKWIHDSFLECLRDA